MVMDRTIGVFEIEREGETLIVTPRTNLGELAFQKIESGADEVLDLLNASSAKNVVLDFRRVDYFGTTALGFFLNLWKRVRGWNGRMALCNASEHAKEILKLTKLDGLWALYGSKGAALRAVREGFSPRLQTDKGLALTAP
jgi:anti-anti-sigma factor